MTLQHQIGQHYLFDARGIEKRLWHPAILGALEALRPDETMRLCIDHDPLPLLAQLRARNGTSFEITYVKRASEETVIDISKKA